VAGWSGGIKEVAPLAHESASNLRYRPGACSRRSAPDPGEGGVSSVTWPSPRLRPPRSTITQSFAHATSDGSPRETSMSGTSACTDNRSTSSTTKRVSTGRRTATTRPTKAQRCPPGATATLGSDPPDDSSSRRAVIATPPSAVAQVVRDQLSEGRASGGPLQRWRRHLLVTPVGPHGCSRHTRPQACVEAAAVRSGFLCERPRGSGRPSMVERSPALLDASRASGASLAIRAASVSGPGQCVGPWKGPHTAN
jgi:hypothetical protein